ncbi:hypothetical protein [Metamycoplasma buccale]|uniref:hypothetical protein n=1 Tax=Metamycoplasma buccale TaxID=55602 RepID=UPI00398EB4CA
MDKNNQKELKMHVKKINKYLKMIDNINNFFNLGIDSSSDLNFEVTKNFEIRSKKNNKKQKNNINQSQIAPLIKEMEKILFIKEEDEIELFNFDKDLEKYIQLLEKDIKEN